MWTFLTIGGGIALILFAVRFLRKGLDRLMGPQIAQWMQRLARTRVRGFFTGIGLAVIARARDLGDHHADRRVRLVHVAVGDDACVVLTHARAVTETRGALVARPRVALRQTQHNKKTDTRG